MNGRDENDGSLRRRSLLSCIWKAILLLPVRGNFACANSGNSKLERVLISSPWAHQVKVIYSPPAEQDPPAPWNENYPGAPRPAHVDSHPNPKRLTVTVEWSSASSVRETREKLAQPLAISPAGNRYVISVLRLPKALKPVSAALSCPGHRDISASHIEQTVAGDQSIVSCYFRESNPFARTDT